MLNKVFLIGKIVTDPELRYFKEGGVITVIRLMTKDEVGGLGKNQ